MLTCTHILDNIGEPGPAHDRVRLMWDQCFKRLQRKTTDRGRSIAIRLPVGAVLRHGDVLHGGTSGGGAEGLASDAPVVVEVVPTALLVVHPSDAYVANVIAYEIGNRHLPVQLTGETVVVLDDGPTRDLLERLGATYEQTPARFEPLPNLVALGVQLAGDFQVRPVRVSP